MWINARDTCGLIQSFYTVFSMLQARGMMICGYNNIIIYMTGVVDFLKALWVFHFSLFSLFKFISNNG